MKHITEASDEPVALKSWEVTDSAWSAFSAEEHMTNGVQAAYNAGMEDAINAANPTSQPAERVAELRVHTSEHPDMETTARLHNEGFAEAMSQVLADDPSAADEWLAAHDQQVRDEVVAAVASWSADEQGHMHPGLPEVLAPFVAALTKGAK